MGYMPWFERALALRRSKNETERNSLMLGHVVSDESPALVHRQSWQAHAYLEGAPGCGKTATLCNLIEQFISFGDVSVIVGDLKGDTPELLMACLAGRDRLYALTGQRLPLQLYYDQVGHATHTFNLFEQDFWSGLNPLQRAGCIAAALGSSHGLTGYGPGWYEGAKFECFQRVFERWPNIRSFRELLDAVGRVIMHEKHDGLHPAIREAGLEGWLGARRLAAIEPLNVVGNAQGMRLSSSFRTPQVIFWRHSSAIENDIVGITCRLWIHSFFSAAAQSQRPVFVVLILDEFQRAVAKSLAVIVEQARSLGIALILANQTIQALVTKDADFRPTISLCRVQWNFNVADPVEQLRVAETSGVSMRRNWTYRPGFAGFGLTRASATDTLTPRIPLNHVKLVSAHPKLSLLTVNQDLGFVQWGGFPQILRTDFHITADEFKRRRESGWPAPEDGAIVPEIVANNTVQTTPSSSVTIEREIIRRPVGPRKKVPPAPQSRSKPRPSHE